MSARIKTNRSGAAARIVEERDGDVRIVAVEGELDIATVDGLRSALEAALSDGARMLVVDLSDVTFMDSVAIAAVVTARHRVGEGCLSVVVTPGSYAALIAEVAGIDGLLSTVSTRDQAIACVREAAGG